MKINCPKCRIELVQVTNDKIKVRTNILIFEKSLDGDFTEDGGIICNNCKSFVKIPIKINVPVKQKFVVENKKSN